MKKMIKPIMKEVSKKKFVNYINNYPRKLEIDILENKINSLNSSVADVSNNLQSTVNDIEEKDWGNRIKKTINQQ